MKNKREIYEALLEGKSIQSGKCIIHMRKDGTLVDSNDNPITVEFTWPENWDIVKSKVKHVKSIATLLKEYPNYKIDSANTLHLDDTKTVTVSMLCRQGTKYISDLCDWMIEEVEE